MFLAVASAASAQDRWPLSWGVAVLEPGSGVRLLPNDRLDGQIRQLLWTPPGGDGESTREVTLVRPVQDCVAAVTADGTGLIVLAGGITESLDLYLVDRDQPGFYVLETFGGRRLPSSFNGGLGSWPLVEGPHVVLLAFEKERRLEFRALDFQGRIHSSRTLPLEINGFTAAADLDSSELRVRFLPTEEELVFHHPLAPRLMLGQGVVEFGTLPVGGEVFREAELRNGGERDLRLGLSIEGDSFRIDGERDLLVEPGRVARVRVGFRPQAGGNYEGRLVVRANSSNPDAEITLRGAALDPVRATDVPPPPQPVRQVTETPDRGVPDVNPVPARPQVGALEIRAVAQDRVQVSGFLRSHPDGGDLEVELEAGARRARAPIGPEGGFSVSVEAFPGERLRLSTVSGSGVRSPTVELGQVLPFLRRVGEELEIRTGPSRSFLLTAVVLDEDGQRIQRMFAAWNGRSDAEGIARVDLERIGPRRAPVYVLVFVEDENGRRRSNLLRLDPDV